MYCYIEKTYKIVTLYGNIIFYSDTSVPQFYNKKNNHEFSNIVFCSRLRSQDLIRMQHLGVAGFSFGSVIGRECL